VGAERLRREGHNAELAIDVTGLSKSFGGKAAVNGLSLRVPRGSIFGFLGPNGSGKTTSIRMLCGLLTPDAGSGTCLGLDLIRDSDRIKRQVGYMTQRFSLYEDLTIRENLDFIARMYGMTNRRQAVDASLARLGLEDRRNQLAGTLSGGWKQRLALASCMLHEPQLLLLDEPTAGVDPKARRDFWEEIHKLAAEGITVLVSTHYMDEAERCTELAYIAYGNLLASGTPNDILANSGLTTWRVEGGDLAELAERLRDCPGAQQVVPFGNALHVSGTDAGKLAACTAGLRADPRWHWQPAEPGLEDVFIQLMDGAKGS
jgi:ABC-2 type transport system ATP-binding protein